nr:MAG TPA: hypothetical protein [Caudoviricetes sp.]
MGRVPGWPRDSPLFLFPGIPLWHLEVCNDC